MEEKLLVNRDIYTEKSFRKKYRYEKIPKTPIKQRFLKFFRPKENYASSVKNFILGIIPILQWLPKYKVKQWLIADIACGLTVGVMHISQGMSYTLLAGQHPIYGLYTSFFPVILYSILGTSRHTSIGSFGLTSLMLGNAMMALVPDPVFEASTGTTPSGQSEEDAWAVIYQQRILLGTGCMFIAGVFLISLSVFQVGSIVIYLSDTMISGFIFAASVHIVVYQIKGLLGLTVQSYTGPLNLVWILRDILLALTSLDEEGKIKTTATVILSIACLAFLITVKQLNEKYKEKIPYNLPLPGEMVVVIVGTVVSSCMDLSEKYGVSIIGNIPSGLPAPSPPPFDEMTSLVKYAIPMGIMGYSVSISMAKIFGLQYGYEIRPNQELVAYGVTNTVCSFFSCIPSFPAMSRSCVQAGSGGKTQIVGFVASGVVLLVLLVLGQYLSTLPKACLASIICVALNGMLMKIVILKDLWKTSKLDFATWLVTAVGTLLLDVVYGLCVGVSLSLLCVVAHTQLTEKEILKRIGETEMYRNVNQYANFQTRSFEGICIGAFRGPLHYLNKESFRNFLNNCTGFDPILEFSRRMKTHENNSNELKIEEKIACGEAQSDPSNHNEKCKREAQPMLPKGKIEDNESKQKSSPRPLQYFILDCAQIVFIDFVGLSVLRSVTEDYLKLDVKLLLANCSGEFYDILLSSGYIEKFSEDVIFLSVHDAMIFASYKVREKHLINDRTEETQVFEMITDEPVV